MATNDFAQKSDLDSSSALGGSKLLSSGGEWKPKSIIDAISEIQQFYVIESKGQDIPIEFLTLEGTLSFFGIGMRSGFSESIFIFLLFPLFQFYLIPFYFHGSGQGAVLMASIPFMLLFVNTGMCFYVSRCYIGTLTRKAINSFFLGRSLVIVLKSLLIYGLYFIAASPQILTPERVWGIAKYFNPEMADKFFYGFEVKVLPHIMPAAKVCSISMLAAAVLPYGTAYLLDWRRQKKQKGNQARVAGQK